MKTKHSHSAAHLQTSGRASALFAATVIGVGFLVSSCTKSTTEPGTCTPVSTDADSLLIHVSSPRGCEEFKVGQTIHVKWTVTDDPNDPLGTGLDILIATNDTDWAYIKTGGTISKSDSNWGDFSWKVTESVSDQGEIYKLAGSSKCRIKVIDYAAVNNKRKVFTTPNFTISP